MNDRPHERDSSEGHAQRKQAKPQEYGDDAQDFRNRERGPGAHVVLIGDEEGHADQQKDRQGADQEVAQSKDEGKTEHRTDSGLDRYPFAEGPRPRHRHRDRAPESLPTTERRIETRRDIRGDGIVVAAILPRPDHTRRFVDARPALDAVEGRRNQMPVLTIAVVGLVAVRAAEPNLSRLESLGDGVERFPTLRTWPGLEIPEGIVAVLTFHGSLPAKALADDRTALRNRVAAKATAPPTGHPLRPRFRFPWASSMPRDPRTAASPRGNPRRCGGGIRRCRPW